jgi:thioredoxin reductase (NADPH)
MDKKIEDLIIIGSGPAGLTAAVYASRAKLNPIIIEGSNPGGQLINTTYVENWPGEKSILGADLMINMKDHAAHFGTQFISESAVKVDFSSSIFKVWTNRDRELNAKCIIIATGATPKKLGCPGESDYWGKGVTTCAVCDGALYPDKKVVIVGGGDTAMEDASFMTKFTKDITIVQNLGALSASKPMQERVLNNPDIKIIYNSTISQIKSNGDHVTGTTITNLKTDAKTELEADGIFIAIGYNPNTGIFKDQINLDDYGYMQLDGQTKTNITGVFAAGDVHDWRYRQAITAAGAGCMAALDAEKYLSSL